MNKTLFHLPIVCILLLPALQPVIAQPFSFSEKDGGILLTENDQPVFYYQKETKSLDGAYPRANYLHPLYGLNGEILTEDFPEDHLHHRGIFWAWHQLLVNGEKPGDPWECKGIEWKVSNVNNNSDADNATLQVEVMWIGQLNGVEKALVNEQTTITCHTTGRNYRIIDFDIRLTANEQDVSIGGSEDAKGYSGFSARLRLPEDVRFVASKGEVTPRETAIEAGGWVDVVASFGDRTAGVVIMADSDAKPAHGWILRSEKSMQNAAWPGRNPVKIAAGETLRLRYRLLLHGEGFPESEIKKVYNDFIKNEENHIR